MYSSSGMFIFIKHLRIKLFFISCFVRVSWFPLLYKPITLTFFTFRHFINNNNSQVTPQSHSTYLYSTPKFLKIQAANVKFLQNFQKYSFKQLKHLYNQAFAVLGTNSIFSFIPNPSANFFKVRIDGLALPFSNLLISA